MYKTLRFTLVSLLMMLCGTVFATETSMSITFKEGSGTSDSGTKVTKAEDIITEGGDYVSAITTADNIYNARQGRGIKFGTSSKPGTLTFTLAKTVKPSKITFAARQYNATETAITVNTLAVTNLTTEFDTYTINYDGNTEVSEVSISTPEKRAYITNVTIYYEGGETPAVTVAKPAITPNGGSFFGTQSVTLSCETEGASIYYTLDGSDPTAESTQYTNAIEVKQTTTVKAIAIKGSDKSAVASATFTAITGYATLASMSTLENNATFAFTGEALIVAKPTAKYVYISDQSGNALIYDATGNLTEAAAVGKTIAANWTGKVSIYKNLSELVADKAIVVKDGDAASVSYPEATAADITADNINKVVTLKGITNYTIDGKNITIKIGETEIKGYNQFGLQITAASEGRTYQMVGAISRYNDDIQFQPITCEADPIVTTLITPTVGITEKFTNVADLAGKTFAIINEAEGKALYGVSAQNLGYDTYGSAFSNANSGYLWKLISLADNEDEAVRSYYMLRLITPKGEEYNVYGKPGFLNSQDANGWCSFILGLTKGNGEDIKNGAVFDVQYVDGQGFSIKSIATGLYKGANTGTANATEPVYFTFATVGSTYIPAVEALLAEGAIWKTIVKDDAALAAYDAAVGNINPAAIEGDGFTEAQSIDAAIIELSKAQPAVAGADFTRTIINPSFETGNINGWTSQDGGNSANNGNFKAATGSFFVEKWTASSGKLSNGSFLQTINGLPIGKYKLTAEMQNREQGNGDAAGTGFFLVANEGMTEAVTADGKTFEVIGTAKRGTLEIGTKLENCSGNWICFDNFKLTYVESLPADFVAAMTALETAIKEAKAIDTTDLQGVEALNSAISTAETTLKSIDATTESLTAAKTALKEAVTAFKTLNVKTILVLKGTVGEEVSLTFGAWDTEDTYSVDFGGEDNVQTALVGIDNKGPVKEDGTTGSATKFTGTVGGDGTITVKGFNDIWYLITTNGVMPTTFDQPKLMNVVQMTITGADVEKVELPAYPKMTQFNFNNSSVKSVDVSKVATLTSLSINSTSASKFEPQLESIDLSKNTELDYLSLQGNTNNHGKLQTLDLSANTKLTKMYVQYNQIKSVTLPEGAALSFINIQDNNLESIDLTTVESIKDTYLSNNKLAAIDLSKMKAASTLNIDGNKLATLTVPVSIKTLNAKNNELTSVSLVDVTTQCNLDGNKLTLATIPAQPASMNTASKAKKFTYAPQAALEVAESLSELDLTAQLTVAKGELNPEAVGETAAYGSWIENKTTTFSFVTESGTALVESTDYEVTEPGKFKFLTAQTEKVHGVMLNAAFPKFTEATPFTTTEFTVALSTVPVIAATLEHTASSYCEADVETYLSKVDAETEHVNNSAFNATWQGAAYAEFSFAGLPANATITEATLTFTGIGESRRARNTDVMLVNAGETLDYTALTAGNAKVNLDATTIQSVSFPKGSSEVFNIDATEQLNALVAGGQRYAIFKFTNNPGGGDIAGKASTNAPTLVITYALGAPAIANASFDANAEDIITVTTQGYQRNIPEGSDQITGLQPVTGWTPSTQTESDPGYVGGIFAYGSENLLNNKVAAPATAPEGSTSPSALGLAAVWGGIAQYTQEVTAPAGDYKLSYTVYNGINTGAVTKNLFGFIAADGTEYLSDVKTFTVGEWATYDVTFTLAEETTGKISVGFIGSGGSGNAPHLFVDNVKLEKVAGIEVALKDLEKAIAAAQAKAATYTVGDGLFMYATSEIEPLNTAVATAQAAYTAAESKAAVEAATATLNAFVETFAPVATLPAADKAYTFELRLGGETPLYMALAESGITIAEEATPLKFVAVEGANGQYNLTNEEGTLFVGLEGSDAWTMSTLADKKAAWTFTALPDGAYHINNLVTAGRFVGTNAADKEAGKPCYADKKTDNGNVDWIIAEYVAPAAPHTWDFTKWSEETVTNLKADAAASKLAGWSDVEKKADAEADANPTEVSKDNCFWYVGGEAEPTANGTAIAELAGLEFNTTYGTSRALAIAVNYQVADASKDFGPYNGPSYLWFGGKNQEIMTIKNVKAGTLIKMGVESHKITDARGLQLFIGETALTDPEGAAVAAPKTYTEQTWAVPAGEGVVNVVVKNTNGCHIYFIDAEIGEAPTPVVPDDPEIEVAEGWHSVIANGNLATDNVANFFSKENGGDPVPSTIVAGAGKNGSRGIVINTNDNPSADWDAQFFIQANENIPAGYKIHVEFDYMATQEAEFDTQSHAEPGNYIHWYCVDSYTAKPEWQHMSKEVEVSAANAEGNGEWGKACTNEANGKPFKTVAFNLSKVKTATTFYFDNIAFWVSNVATGIQNIKSEENAEKTIYNLNGQKVNKAQKGLFIINGKKVVVK